MRDYARDENGCMIVMASCCDERFPPENMLDGNDKTFWMTTGMFPQEFVLRMDSLVPVSKITTLSINVKKLSVEKCESQRPDSFEKVFEVELANRGDRIQQEMHQVNIRAKFLRFTILSGHGEFAAMNRVSVFGGDDDGYGGGGGYDDPNNAYGGGYGGGGAGGYGGGEEGY